jgi:hypothetical protein
MEKTQEKSNKVTLTFNLENGVSLESSENITAQNLIYVFTHLSSIIKLIAREDERNPSYEDIMGVVKTSGETFAESVQEQLKE